MPDEDNNTNQPDSVTASGGKKKEPNKGQSNEVQLEKNGRSKEAKRTTFNGEKHR